MKNKRSVRHFKPKNWVDNKSDVHVNNRIDNVRFSGGGIDWFYVLYFSALQNEVAKSGKMKDSDFFKPLLQHNVDFEDMLTIWKNSDKGLLVGKPLAKVTKQAATVIKELCADKYKDKPTVYTSFIKIQYAHVAERNKCMVYNGTNHDSDIECRPSITGDTLKPHGYFLAKEKFAVDYPDLSRDKILDMAVNYDRKTFWKEGDGVLISKITNEEIPFEDQRFGDFIAGIIERDIGITRDG